MTAGTLGFGTSGLRGLAAELDGPPAFAYSLAFGNVMLKRGDVRTGEAVFVGRDLRPSSPSIASRCAAGLRAAGLAPVDCGVLPTPALAFHAMASGAMAIMVTGSHIPEDRNGLKFYRRDGEIDKRDELAISEAASDVRVAPAVASASTRADGAALARYRRRCVEMLSPAALERMRVGVYQHSSAARDLLVDVLGALGAEVIALGRSDAFVALDTEALRPEDETLCLRWAREHRLDAIVSTDGDADRPLIADETGRALRGDLVGAVTACVLGADCVVTPVNSNSGIERGNRFARVLRTRIGSPYVIEGMARAHREGACRVIGFEANGGVLIGSPVGIGNRTLTALPTRDALVPILAFLDMARRSCRPLSTFADDFAFSATASGRLENIAPSASGDFLQRLRNDSDFRERVVDGMLCVASIDITDGVRMVAADGTVLHYRASGNAPELRCYVEASGETSARTLLSLGLAGARAYLAEQGCR